MINTLKSAKSNRAFTLIELIVVIAVIGILVLLAAPKFLGQTEKAKVTQIQSDIRAVEGIVDMERVKAESENEDYFDNLSKLENNEIDELITSNSVYDKSGKIDQPKGGPFYNTPESVVKEAGSSLPGNFIVNKDGKVYYVSSSGEGGGEPEGEHVAKNEDFEWIEDLGGYRVEGESGWGYYRYIGNKKRVEIPYEINGHKMTSHYKMFSDSNENIEEIISTNSEVDNMSGMFMDSQATSLDLNSFNTSKVTNMSEMFWGSRATSLDLSSFDTSNVTDMNRMFWDSKATSLSLSDFDTSKVTDMSRMFHGSKATSLTLSDFDTSKVTNMQGMFYGSEATELDLSSFDASKVTDMSMMFGNSQATELDLRNWDTSKVTNMSWMFWESQADSLDLSSFGTSNVTNMSIMFAGSQATSLTFGDKFDTSNVTNMAGMFAGSQATELDLSDFDTSNMTNMAGMFSGSEATEGYAKTPDDVNRFHNSETERPSGLEFEVK